ncbi:MAG: hypothetical protein NXI04_28665 [Planctomycetaceae bacterium]|nr:hypothetical protein [Planctomycetaceae bacterium]
MNRRQSCLSAFAAFVVAASLNTVEAQLIRAKLDQGFVRTSSIAMSVDEMLGAQKQRAADQPIVGPGYPALFISEVQFKPVRFVRMEVTDPKTGETKRELVWYMIYRSILRDYTELAGPNQPDLLLKLEDPDLQPSNDIESASSLPLQIPRFVLQTNDAGPMQTYSDEVSQQIRQSIFDREFKDRSPGTNLRSSIGAIVEADRDEWVSVDDPDPLSKAVYGVAVWRNVDQTTDYFTIQMHGFSNAYRITPEGVVERKVIEQKFGRPGDEYNQDEAEFRVLGDPSWKYVPTKSTIDVPDYAKILRK